MDFRKKLTTCLLQFLALFLLTAFLLRFPTTVKAETIDTLDFFISKHAVGTQEPKSTGVTQYILGNSSYYFKTGSAYEYHTWDNNFIYLTQDTSVGNYPIGGGIANSYRIISGIWMKRFMQVGEKIDVPSKVDWYDNTCKVIQHWDWWPYYVYLENHTKMNFGGDLGVQEVIVLRFDYGSGYEKFYYSKEWGYIRWEEFNQSGQAMRSADFNRLREVETRIRVSCGTPLPRVPTASPTNSYNKPGDANGDGKVDGRDYVIWLQNYGKSTSKGVSVGDFNKSGKVDGVDYTIWLAYLT